MKKERTNQEWAMYYLGKAIKALEKLPNDKNSKWSKKVWKLSIEVGIAG